MMAALPFLYLHLLTKMRSIDKDLAKKKKVVSHKILQFKFNKIMVTLWLRNVKQNEGMSLQNAMRCVRARMRANAYECVRMRVRERESLSERYSLASF